MPVLRVEGWRGINHSYAMVNQWQLLELCRRSGLDLCHVDRPFFNAGWNAAANSGGFSEARRQAIGAIRTSRPGEAADVVYRIAFPYDFSECPDGRLFVFGTSEYQHIDGMAAGRDTALAARDPRLSIVTPSRWSKAGFVAAGFDPERVHVVSHGIDPDTFRPVDRRQRKTLRNLMRVRNDDFVLLSVGAMTENKGIDLLLTAFARLRHRHRHVRLVLKDQSNLYGLTADRILAGLGRSPQAHLFTEDVVSSIVFVSHNLGLTELAALYGSVDCYVSPYRAEGFNLTPLEAAACGVPVVVTRGGATDDYFAPALGLQVDSRPVQSGGRSWLEPDPDALFDALVRMVEGGRRFDPAAVSAAVHGRFTWARVTDELARALGV
jgi:glycosyltransferase involved in cell wall biosynthesis